MSVLTGLKEWLTVPEAAKYLSAAIGEDVSESGIYRLAFDGHLQLSLYFVSIIFAPQCIPVPFSREWLKTKEDFPHVFDWALGEIERTKGKEYLDSISSDEGKLLGAMWHAAMCSKYTWAAIHTPAHVMRDEAMFGEPTPRPPSHVVLMLDEQEFNHDSTPLEGVIDLLMPSVYVQREIKRRVFSDSIPIDSDPDSDDDEGGIVLVCGNSEYVLTQESADGTEIPETRFPSDSVPVIRTAVLRDFVSSLKDKRSKTETIYQLPMHARLEPRNHPFKGGRITETDPPITLDEAAKFASRHAGTEITPGDFLRAAARGEITLRAIVHREAKLKKHDGGIYCNQGEPTENTVPKGCIPNLPLSACRQLASAGRASWRTFDGFEHIDGELMRFTVAALIDSEPDFDTVVADCRVTGDAVHALADEYIDTPAPPSGTTEKPTPPAPVVTPAAPITRHKLKTDLLDAPIEKAIKQAGCLDTAAVFTQLKELALNGEALPFTGVFEGAALCYTNDNDNPAVLTKEALRKRLSERRKKEGNGG